MLICRFCGPDGSCTSGLVSSIMRSLGQNPSEAEIQVFITINFRQSELNSRTFEFTKFVYCVAK